jgi:hypothetical protein
MLREILKSANRKVSHGGSGAHQAAAATAVALGKIF